MQVRHIGDDPIDTQQLRVGKHHARVDDDRRVGPGEREHVHAELTESAKGHHFKHRKQSEHIAIAAKFLAERFTRREPLTQLNQAAGTA